MSPKNKGKYGKGKAAAIPETDEFISGIDRVIRALRPHAMKLAVFAGVVLIVVLGATGWTWWKNRKAEHATDLFAQAMALSQVPVVEEEPEDPKDPKDPKADAKEPTPPAPTKAVPDPRGLPESYPSFAARAKAVLAVLEELRSDYGSTGPAVEALLLEADALYQLGKYGEAAARYREFLDAGGPDTLVLTAHEGLGYALEAEAMAQKDPGAQHAGLEKAMAAFAAIQDKPEGPRRDEALFHKARILASLGKKDEAVKTFQQILADHPDSTLKQDVEMRLVALHPAPAK